MTRNPNWTRDELILALELYFKLDRRSMSDQDPLIVELVQFLKTQAPHSAQLHARSQDSIYLKLCNFMLLDPNEPSGLDAGSKLDQVVWDEFADDHAKLKKAAKAIRESAAS